MKNQRPDWIPKVLKNGRKFIVSDLGEHKLNCLNCKKFLPESDFYNRRGAAASKCKSCEIKNKKENKHWNKSTNRKKFFAACRRLEFQSQLLKCKRCGRLTKRSDWPREPIGHHMNKTCCVSRLKNQNDELARDSQKICFKCETVKDLSDFSYNDNRSCHHPFCKDCVKSSAALVASRESRKQKMLDADDGSLTKKTIGELFGSTKNCPCCGRIMQRNDKHMDHINPLALGGAHSITNVMVLCRECNTRKHAKSFDDWYASLDEKMKKSLKMNIIKNKNLAKLCDKVFSMDQQCRSVNASDR